MERIMGRNTHDDIRHLAKRLVCDERRLLVLTLGGVDWDELIRDVALRSNECYATRASGPRKTVQFDGGTHDVLLFDVYPSGPYIRP